MRLRFVRRAQQLGFTLDEVHTSLRLTGAESDHIRAELRSLVAAHVADIRAKIANLRAMARMLFNAICEGASGQRSRCPIMDVLSALAP